MKLSENHVILSGRGNRRQKAKNVLKAQARKLLLEIVWLYGERLPLYKT